MSQERVIAQVKPRLQCCLERRDRPGILALTTWLVHRHGHPLLQQLLSQPEWSSHRLWWGEQIDKTVPTTGKERQGDTTWDKTPIAARSTSDPVKPTPGPRQHPQPQAGLHLDGHPKSRPELDLAGDDSKLTPAQVTKQRLKMDKAAKSVPMQGDDGEIPTTVTQVAGKERPQKRAPDRQHRSLHLRGWLPRSHLPHQCPRQDAA